MHTIIDPTASKKNAFVRGFWKGMAAPLFLFSAFDLPVQAQPTAFQPLQRRPRSDQSDWVRVGESLRLAAAKQRNSGGE